MSWSAWNSDICPTERIKSSRNTSAWRRWSAYGKKKWQKFVFDVVARLKAAMVADYILLGGGNVKKLIGTAARLASRRQLRRFPRRRTSLAHSTSREYAAAEAMKMSSIDQPEVAAAKRRAVMP